MIKPAHQSAKTSQIPLVLRRCINKIAKKHGIKNVRVFGSFARGQQSPTSDIDLLVDLPKKMTLFELAGLKVDLEEQLKRKVDVVPSDTIKPALQKRILSEALAL